jgi:hypothetical protein
MDETSTRTGAVAALGTTSAVSWAAILAGVFVAVAVSLLLIAVITGIDLASLNTNASATTFTVLTAIALIVTQWISAALGGYITGRLRTRWTGTHTHEVFFRDTAHGFITWCVATVVMASGLATAASGMGARMHASGTSYSLHLPHAAQALLTDSAAGALEQSSDFATAPFARQTSAGRPRAEALDEADTGALMATADADDVSGDSLRKQAAISSTLTALSMVIGAFIASVAGALGGRLRDLHP